MPEISTKTVLGEENSLEGCSFYIKDYQRGYRWGAREIIDLLNDLEGFGKRDTTLKYCLQPLVIKKIDNLDGNYKLLDGAKKYNKNECCYEVIDGQQRLTTILLILNICYGGDSSEEYLPYEISYPYKRALDDIYIKEAQKIIREWFISFKTLSRDKKYEISSKIHQRVLFVWYEVNDTVSSEELFSKINIGKIPLTNAELFKAVLLNPDGLSDNIRELDKIAFEWDKIEHSLRDDDFWFFLSNDDRDGETRIDYLLDLYALQLLEVSEQRDENNPLWAFSKISEKLREDNSFKNRKEIWEGIVRIHDKLKSWYDNIELFHYVGYLTTVNKNTTKIISELMKKTNEKRCSETKEIIVDAVKETVRKRNEKDALDNLDYEKHKEKIRNILLLFNLETKTKDGEKIRFSFKQYKKLKWDIEHIHARAAESTIKNMSEEKKENVFKPLCEEWKGKTEQELCVILAQNSVQDENGIENLTLLDEKTNREYQNNPFNDKRIVIIDKCKTDTFVPVCTKNVFLKMYTKNPDKMTVWTQTDADEYLNAIKETLKDFLEEENNQ